MGLNPIVAHLLGPLAKPGPSAALELRDAGPSMNFNGYLELVDFVFQGQRYIGGSKNAMNRLAADAYERNGPIGALISVRSHVFSEVRFQFQRLANGRSADLFGNADLAVLESPWPGGTTRSLLSVMELDGSLAGNCYLLREQGTFVNQPVLTRLDPARTMILTAGLADQGVTYGQRLVGYSYQEKPGGESVIFLPDQVAHFKPLPDSAMPQYRGKSWLSNVLADVNADQDMVDLKRSFLKNAVMPSVVFAFDTGVSKDQFESTVKTIREGKTGSHHAGEALFLGGGVDPKVIGTDVANLDISDTQGAGETRLAAAAGVPAVVVGFSEGVKGGSSLNAGNYSAARRRFADGTMRPLWHEAAGAMSAVVNIPTGCRLWYDDRDVSFLQEDVKDAADILQTQASTMQILVNSGWTKDSIKAAMTAGGDWSLLADSGMNSVQLQPPASATPAPQGGQQ